MKKITVYFDNECPFCKEYSRYIDLRKKYELDLIDARGSPKEIASFKERGFDINDGVIVELEGELFQGADAVKLLDGAIEKNSLIDKSISAIVRFPLFKRAIYPMVLIVRKVVLKILGRSMEI